MNICITCKKEYRNSHGATKLRCPRCSHKYRGEQYKLILIEEYGSKCVFCGYNKCRTALEFHHINPENKLFNIDCEKKGINKLKEEAKKCLLVCANCHREIHAGVLSLKTISTKDT